MPRQDTAAALTRRSANRYVLRICRGRRDVAVIQVLDRCSGALLIDMSGDVARHLIESGAVPTERAGSGEHDCDKTFVWHLVLAGAAAQRMVDRMAELEAGLHRTLDSLLTRPAVSPSSPARRALPGRSAPAAGRSAASGYPDRSG